jgi:hypothetical protein
MKQTGIIRVNDVDCVDDTSVAQWIICQVAIKNMLAELGLIFPLKIGYAGAIPSSDWSALEGLWISMSDALSDYYVGSKSLVSPVIYHNRFRYYLQVPINLYTRMCRYYISRFQSYVDQDRLEKDWGTINIKAGYLSWIESG